MRLFTPDFVKIKTPNRCINQSFDIAVKLIDELRQCAKDYYKRDGYYAVSDGKYVPMHNFDPRDYDHINKIYSYLWGTEAGLDCSIGENIFIDQLDESEGYFKFERERDQRGIHIGHYSKYAADFFKYIHNVDFIKENWERMLKFIKWVFKEYDTEESHLIEDGGETLKTFWGYYIGEPNHFPINLSSKSKVVIASMTFCGLLKQMQKFAIKYKMPEKEYLIEKFENVFNKLEHDGYSEIRGYYYIQYDHFNKQWYFSLNGACEESRELLVIPYYVDEVAENDEKAKNVSRVIYKVLKDDFVFPMPITYPSYLWYGGDDNWPYHSFGMDRFVFKGCWDNSYHNCINLLNKTGLVDIIPEAIRRRSEAYCRDNDCIEWYYRDGSVGEVNTSERYHRDRYGISATAHIASIVEGLFGIRPAKPGFEEINIHPAFPYKPASSENAWINNDIEIVVALPRGKKLEYVYRFDLDKNEISFKTNNAGILAHVRLPICSEKGVKSIKQGDKELNFAIVRKMDTDFICFDQLLNGQETIIFLQ